MRIQTVAAAAAIAACGFWGAGPATAETLRLADSLPAEHFFTTQATRYWMEEVEKRTGGKVTFEHYPAQQLGKAKDLFALTQSGTVDIGYVVPSYVSDKLPLSSVAELPGGFATSCEGTMAFWKLAQGDGLLAREEFGKAGVRVLFAVVMPPYQVFSRMPLTSVDSIGGLKLRTSSPAQDGIISALGGVPVRITAPELFDALSRGTVDGMVFPTASSLTYDVARLANAVTRGEHFGSAVLTVMISQARWSKLDADVQQIMAEAGEEATRRICAYTDGATQSDFEKIAAQGVTVVEFSDADKNAIKAAGANLADAWAEANDKRGLPGTELVKAFEAATR